VDFYALHDNLPRHPADEGQAWTSYRSPDQPFMTDPGSSREWNESASEDAFQ